MWNDSKLQLSRIILLKCVNIEKASIKLSQRKIQKSSQETSTLPASGTLKMHAKCFTQTGSFD